MKLKILLINNYDSFTNNLVHLFFKANGNIEVYIKYNDDDSLLLEFDYDFLIISPGPGDVNDTGLLYKLFDKIIIPKKIPVFGVCLGMQFVGSYFGMSLVRAKKQIHGQAVEVKHNEDPLFYGVSDSFKGARYNSLMLIGSSNELEVIAVSDEMYMAIKHKKLPILGVQFHPESFMSEYGVQLVKNFMEYYV